MESITHKYSPKILLLLKQVEEANESQLARRLNVSNRTGVTHALHALEKGSLVTIEFIKPLEKRIRLTAKGLQVAAIMEQLSKILTK